MRVSYRAMRMGAQLLYILYGRGRVYGLRNIPARGPVLLACNHQSFFDPVLVGMPIQREVHFMARDSLFRNRYFAGLITHLNAFPVKRATADVGAIKESLRRLRAGAALVAFPEGTRTRDGRISPLHAGIMAIARRANCPVVPTIVEGAYEIWPRNRKLPTVARLWVEYAEPIDQKQLAAIEPAAAAAWFTARMRTAHNDLRRRIGRIRPMG